jgi:integrase
MKGPIREVRLGTWELMVELPRDPVTGKRRRKWATVKGSKRKAEDCLNRMVVDARERKARSSSASTEHLILEWLTFARTELTPRTIQGYQWRIEKQILPALGAVPADELEPSRIDRFYRELLAGGSSPSTIRQTHAIIRRAFNQAMKWGWVDMNPALLASPPRVNAYQVIAPSVEQLTELLKEARASHPQWEAMIALAAVTGLRSGELCALHWSDFKEGRVNVSRSLSYTPATGITEGPTKSRQSRLVTLGEIGAAIVERQRQDLINAAAGAAIDRVEDPYLFFGEPDGSKPLHPDSISKVFRSVADRFGWKDLHFHSLRHFSATQLVAAGVDVRTVSGRLGHSDPSITLRVYSHVLEAKDREAANILGRLLET